MTIKLNQDIAQQARQMDSADPLKSFADQFHIPNGVIYLDGNSLGVMPKSAPDAIAKTVTDEWGNGLIRSWNDAGWVAMPTKIGDMLAKLLGADAGEMVVTDTISINLYKTISYALSLTDKKTILVEHGTFPSDLYVAGGVADSHAGVSVKTIPDHADTDGVITALTPDIGVAVISDVNYKTARLLDMAKINAHATANNIMVIWDLAHSAGACDVNLKRDGALMAVGCTYKYLNGGPGSPAFVYVDKSLQGQGKQPITGWFSHQNMFAMSPDYTPAPDIRQFQTGTYSAIAYRGLETSMHIWQTVDMEQVREKSLALTDWFIQCMEPVVQKYGFGCITPTDHAQRGSHVSLTTDGDGYAIVQALIARGVIGDYRSPNVMRFGFTPLYVSYTDVAMASAHFGAVMDNAEYDKPEFKIRGAVT